MAPFYEWSSTASRLQPLRGGSLLFTTQTFLVLIPGSQSICSANQLGCFYMIGGLLVNGLRAAPTNCL